MPWLHRSLNFEVFSSLAGSAWELKRLVLLKWLIILHAGESNDNCSAAAVITISGEASASRRPEVFRTNQNCNGGVFHQMSAYSTT
jgi:hypothetical protein